MANMGKIPRNLASCLTLAFVLSALGQDAQSRVTELFKSAKSGSIQAIEALAADATPDATAALNQLTELPVNSSYNNALRAARAKAGVPGAFLDLADDALFGMTSTHFGAMENLIKVGGPRTVKVLRLLLDDDTGASPAGDVVYLSNAQDSLVFLPRVMTPPDAALANALVLPFLDARRRWHTWFASREPALASGELDELAAEAVKRGRLADLAAVTLVGDQAGYQRLLAIPGAFDTTPQGRVLQDALGIAYGNAPCNESVLKRIRALNPGDQRVILKTLALGRRSAGAWVLCRIRSSIQAETSSSPESLSLGKFVEALLWNWKRDGARMVPVYTERSQMDTCSDSGLSGSCLSGGTPIPAILGVVADLYATDPNRSDAAMQTLERLEPRAWAIRALRGLLVNGVPPPADHDLFFDSPSYIANRVLRRLIPSPPNASLQARARFSAWEDYFGAHPELFDVAVDWPVVFQDLIAAGDAGKILAAGRLVSSSEAPGVRSLVLAARPGNPLVQRALQMVAARLGDENAFAALQTYLRNRPPQTIRTAIDEVAYVGGQRALGVLWELRTVAGNREQIVLPALIVMRTLVPDPPYWTPFNSLSDALKSWQEWFVEPR
jgi:hypothetical protein